MRNASGAESARCGKGEKSWAIYTITTKISCPDEWRETKSWLITWENWIFYQFLCFFLRISCSFFVAIETFSHYSIIPSSSPFFRKHVLTESDKQKFRFLFLSSLLSSLGHTWSQTNSAWLRKRQKGKLSEKNVSASSSRLVRITYAMEIGKVFTLF